MTVFDVLVPENYFEKLRMLTYYSDDLKMKMKNL